MRGHLGQVVGGCLAEVALRGCFGLVVTTVTPAAWRRADVIVSVKSHWNGFDLAVERVVYNVPVGMSAAATSCRFSPDNQALVQSVLRNGDHIVLYSPLDGSTPHTD